MAFFESGSILPEINAAKIEGAKLERVFRIRQDAALFECVGWLALGVELGYFDRASTDALLERYHYALLPNSSVALQAVRDIFPGLSDLFETYRARKTLNIISKSRFKEPTRMLIPFRSLHLMAASWARDALAQAFTAALNFAPESTWDRFAKSRKTDPGQRFLLLVNLRERNTLPLTTRTVYAGFLATLQHLANSREVFRNMASEGIAEEDFFEFRRACRNIQFWRVNLRDRIGRFTEIAENVAGGLTRELRAQKPAADTAFYWNELESLAEYWLEGGTHLPKTIGAG